MFWYLDAHKGYWQFPLSVESQEICSFLTHEVVFSSTRLLQGQQDSVFAFQNGMEEVIGPELLYRNVLVWIDDILIFAKSEREYLDVVQKLFRRLGK